MPSSKLYADLTAAKEILARLRPKSSDQRAPIWSSEACQAQRAVGEQHLELAKAYQSEGDFRLAATHYFFAHEHTISWEMNKKAIENISLLEEKSYLEIVCQMHETADGDRKEQGKQTYKPASQT